MGLEPAGSSSVTLVMPLAEEELRQATKLL